MNYEAINYILFSPVLLKDKKWDGYWKLVNSTGVSQEIYKASE